MVIFPSHPLSFACLPSVTCVMNNMYPQGPRTPGGDEIPSHREDTGAHRHCHEGNIPDAVGFKGLLPLALVLP